MPKKDENDPCSLIERLSSSQMARRLADYCREKELDVRVIATLTPAEVAELVEGDAEQAESLLRKLNDALAVETVKGDRKSTRLNSSHAD